MHFMHGMRNHAASSRTAASAVQAGWVGLCRIAIYRIEKEHVADKGCQIL
jgi:hypothetical protein